MDRTDQSPVTIAVLSDFHVSEPDHPEAEERLQRLHAVIEAIRASKPDLVLAPGDLTENGEPVELQACLQCLQRLETPFRLVPGNHDVGDKVIGGRPGVTSSRIAQYRAIVGADAYSEHVMGVHLIGLNGPVLGSGLPEEERQWHLLESALEGRSADTLSAHPPCLIMLHYPPYIEAADETAGDYWTLEAEPRRRLLGIAVARQVSVVLSGHLHRPLWTSYRGVSLATAPSVAFGLPFGVQPTGWMTLTIAGDGQVRRELRYT